MIFLLAISVILLLLAIAFPLVVASGGGDLRDLKENRPYILATKSGVELQLHKVVYWLADHRPLLAVLGAVGLLLVVLIR